MKRNCWEIPSELFLFNLFSFPSKLFSVRTWKIIRKNNQTLTPQQQIWFDISMIYEIWPSMTRLLNTIWPSPPPPPSGPVLTIKRYLTLTDPKSVVGATLSRKPMPGEILETVADKSRQVINLHLLLKWTIRTLNFIGNIWVLFRSELFL